MIINSERLGVRGYQAEALLTYCGVVNLNIPCANVVDSRVLRRRLEHV